MVGPPSVATKINASIAACHGRRQVLGLGEHRDVVASVPQSDKLAALGKSDRILELARPVSRHLLG
jgi:hypothetical protein